jgi:outer membrane immunogenic protein
MGWERAGAARISGVAGLLVYGTGGVAWQNIGTSVTCQFAFADPICAIAPGTPSVTVSNSTTLTGGTIGGGIETKISTNWILRGEYRYSDFGTFSTQANLNAAGEPTIVAYQLHLKTQIATIGIAYKFGGPVVAKY